MRVIAGEARRLPLVSPQGKETRPTTDRIKETLFNIIQKEIPGCSFLDLFSGSGAIGIEALSRGAKKATFVEIAREALSCIDINLKKTKMKERAVVLPMEVTYGVSKLSQMGETFDVIFIDPPYQSQFEEKMLNVLSESSICKEGTLIIMEMVLNLPIDFINEEQYEIERVKKYKTNQHVFLRVR